jgi:dihydrofolate reductase
MNTSKSTITLHMVSSLDGFIARNDNTVSWLNSSGDVYEAGVSEDTAADLVNSIDCYVLGSRTYEHALQLGWPYGETPTVVVTTRRLPAHEESVEFYSGDLKRLADEILRPRYRNIWLVGGAMLCQRFLALGLVDEIRLSIMPVLLGDGLRLFASSSVETRWRLKDVGRLQAWIRGVGLRERLGDAVMPPAPDGAETEFLNTVRFFHLG